MSHVRVCTVLAMLSKSDLSLFAFYKESQDLQKMAEKRVGQDCQSRPFACGAIFYFYLINGLAYSRRELDFCKCVWRVVDRYVHAQREKKQVSFFSPKIAELPDCSCISACAKMHVSDEVETRGKIDELHSGSVDLMIEYKHFETQTCSLA